MYRDVRTNKSKWWIGANDKTSLLIIMYMMNLFTTCLIWSENINHPKTGVVLQLWLRAPWSFTCKLTPGNWHMHIFRSSHNAQSLLSLLVTSVLHGIIFRLETCESEISVRIESRIESANSRLQLQCLIFVDFCADSSKILRDRY